MSEPTFAPAEVADFLPFTEPAWFAEVAHLAPPAKPRTDDVWIATVPELAVEPEPAPYGEVPESWPIPAPPPLEPTWAHTPDDFEPLGFEAPPCPMGDGSFELREDAA